MASAAIRLCGWYSSIGRFCEAIRLESRAASEQFVTCGSSEAVQEFRYRVPGHNASRVAVVHETDNLLLFLGTQVTPHNLVVVDESVAEWAYARLDETASIVVIRAAKTSACLFTIWEALESCSARSLIAIGGGTLSDVAGFAAATYRRGIPLAVVPTTLLGMVDAAIGGKNSIDVGSGKNVVGSIHPPSYCLCVLSALATLPSTEVRFSLSEVVKIGMLYNHGLLELLEAYAAADLGIYSSALFKDIVFKAALEKGRVVEDPSLAAEGLLYGHAIGHAVEKVCSIDHGRAVSIGLSIEGLIAVALQKLPQEHKRRQDEILRLLEINLPGPTQLEEVVEQMTRYKLYSADTGLHRLILPNESATPPPSVVKLSNDGLLDILSSVLP